MTSCGNKRQPCQWRRCWTVLGALCAKLTASDLQSQTPLTAGSSGVKVTLDLGPASGTDEAPMELHWHHPSGLEAVLGKCWDVPPLHGANCIPLVTGRVMNGIWDCARLMQQSESEGGDTMNVNVPLGFCQVHRCGPEGNSPLAQTAGLHVPYAKFPELPFEMVVYSFRCAEPRKLIRSEDEQSVRWDDDDKSNDYWTTSRDFKRDLRQFFGPLATSWTVLELGSYHGGTSRVLSDIFKQVIAVDASDVFLGRNKLYNSDRSNIMFVRLHTRFDDLDALRNNDVQVVMVDAEHEYQSVRMDVADVLKVFKDSVQYLIFDDYGTDDGVHRAVSDLVREGRLQILGGIGKKPPWKYHEQVVRTWEGVVCKVLAGPTALTDALEHTQENSTAGAVGCMLDRTYFWMVGSMMCNEVQIRLEAGGEVHTTRGPGRWRRDQSSAQEIWLEWPSTGGEMETWYLRFEDRCEKFAAAMIDKPGSTAAGVSEAMLESMLRRIFVSVNHEFCNTANECRLRQNHR